MRTWLFCLNLGLQVTTRTGRSLWAPLWSFRHAVQTGFSDLKVAFRVLLLGAANGSGKLSLEIEAALPWQSDVEHEESGVIRPINLQKLGNGREQTEYSDRAPAADAQPALEARIVVDDQYRRFCVRYCRCSRNGLPNFRVLGVCCSRTAQSIPNLRKRTTTFSPTSTRAIE